MIQRTGKVVASIYFVGICLYGNYIGWRFCDFMFGVGYMEYHIKSIGITVGEALVFLNNGLKQF